MARKVIELMVTSEALDVETCRKVIDNLSRCMHVGSFLLTGGADCPEGGRSVWQSVAVGDDYIWQLMEKAM